MDDTQKHPGTTVTHEQIAEALGQRAISTSRNPIIAHFRYDHLPEHLQTVSKPFGDLAASLDQKIPDGAEKSAGLRKLLEAKDCMVRASLGA